MAAIFESVDELIDRSLGVSHIGTSAPHYRHKSSALALRHKPSSFSASGLLRAIYQRIQQNWNTGQRVSLRLASAENWRWEKKLHISERNTSREKQVEKCIAAVCGEDWVNQVPTASGLLNSSSERHCNIDLVHRLSDEEFEFIELKFDSDTPLFAAFEILRYGLLYLFSRKFSTELGYSALRKPLLQARVVHLCVLAPPEYYRPFSVLWLAREFNDGMNGLDLSGCKLDFRFESMPWPHNGNVAGALASRVAL